MFLRRRGDRDGTGGADVFRGLRSQMLDLDPASVGIAPTAELPSVFAFLMDVTQKGGIATIAAVADGPRACTPAPEGESSAAVPTAPS